MCNKISCLFSNIFYLVEKLTVMTACVGLLTCLVVTLIMMLMLGIGLGYNYCYVDYQSRARYRYIPAHYYTVRPARSKLRSGLEPTKETTSNSLTLKYLHNEESTYYIESRSSKLVYKQEYVKDISDQDVITKKPTYFNLQSKEDLRGTTVKSKEKLFKFWAPENSTTTAKTIQHKLTEKIVNKTVEMTTEKTITEEAITEETITEDTITEEPISEEPITEDATERTKETITTTDLDLSSFFNMLIGNTKSSIRESTEEVTLKTWSHKQDFAYTDSANYYTTRSVGDQYRLKQPLFYQYFTDVTTSSSVPPSRTSTVSTITNTSTIPLKTPSTKITYKREHNSDNAKESNMKYYKFWAIAETTESTESTKIAKTEPKTEYDKSDNVEENHLAKYTLKTDRYTKPTRTTKGTYNKLISINGLDLMALLSQLRAENRNYSLQILTS